MTGEGHGGQHCICRKKIFLSDKKLKMSEIDQLKQQIAERDAKIEELKLFIQKQTKEKVSLQENVRVLERKIEDQNEQIRQHQMLFLAGKSSFNDK